VLQEPRPQHIGHRRRHPWAARDDLSSPSVPRPRREKRMVLIDKRSSSAAGIEDLSSGDSAGTSTRFPSCTKYTFCHADEETGTHYPPRNFTNRSIERHRILDAAERAVEDAVAVVADESGWSPSSVAGSAPRPTSLRRQRASPKGAPRPAAGCHARRAVGRAFRQPTDDHQPTRGRRDDFLTRTSAPPRPLNGSRRGSTSSAPRRPSRFQLPRFLQARDP
jgi:hypothetical protein